MKGFKKLDHTTLAEGEITGHSHRAIGERVTLWGDDSGAMILDAPLGATVVHEEHGPITLPAGKYERKITLEFDHFVEESRAVRD